MGDCTGISFIDFTALKVFHIKWLDFNRVFDGMATTGKTTLGWFFGFKLHIVINDKGEIISFVITQGNVNDRHPLSLESFISKVSGKLYADRGYVSQKLAEKLFVDVIHFVARMRNNMKGGELPLQDRVMLRKRAVIESVNDELKNICHIQHTKYRYFTSFIPNPIAGLLAYSFLPKKPSVKVDFVNEKQFMVF